MRTPPVLPALAAAALGPAASKEIASVKVCGAAGLLTRRGGPAATG